MKNLISKVLKINKKFPKPMNKEKRFIQLVEEVGELANAIAVAEGHKSKKCARAELKDSFADVLFDLIALASLYKIDLEKEMEKMLKRLEKRIKNKEFNFVPRLAGQERSRHQLPCWGGFIFKAPQVFLHP